jgi:hypothetical protein
MYLCFYSQISCLAFSLKQERTVRSSCWSRLHVSFILFQLSYHVTDMHEAWYAYYVMPPPSNASFAGFVQTVSATWRRSELTKWEATMRNLRMLFDKNRNKFLCQVTEKNM